MSVKPQAGMIIEYAFTWEATNKDATNKARPAMIIIATNGRVLVLPITHTAPPTGEDGIEIPHSIKHSLGLDDARQWIMLNSPNVFTWMGFDVTPSDAYHIAPRWFYEQVAKKYLEIVKAGRTIKMAISHFHRGLKFY